MTSAANGAKITVPLAVCHSKSCSPRSPKRKVTSISSTSSTAPSPAFVKDLSRLGRNYIGVGRLTEEFFPEHDIRFVSVSAAIDTDEGENELAPIRNLFNEWYSRDISKKRRISNIIRGSAGESMVPSPYGYTQNPDGSKIWVVDPEAAAVVRRIFMLTLDGHGSEQIAAILTSEHVITPTHYWKEHGVSRPNRTPTL